jgi:hypothetical protein
MTPKQEAAVIDPDYFKAERSQTRRFWGSLAVAIVAIVAATYAAVETHQNSTEITQIQHSACQVEPAGRECQEAKRESSQAASIATTCIPFFKAGYPCPKPGSTAAERQARRQGQAGSGSAQELNSGSDGGEAPGPGGSGEGPAPGKGGDSAPSVPPKSTGPRHHPPAAPPEGGGEGEGAPVEQGASQASEGSTSSEAPAAAEQTAPEARHESVLESAGATVGEVINGAGHVVEAAGCGLAAPVICPKP